MIVNRGIITHRMSACARRSWKATKPSRVCKKKKLFCDLLIRSGRSWLRSLGDHSADPVRWENASCRRCRPFRRDFKASRSENWLRLGTRDAWRALRCITISWYCYGASHASSFLPPLRLLSQQSVANRDARSRRGGWSGLALSSFSSRHTSK